MGEGGGGGGRENISNLAIYIEEQWVVCDLHRAQNPWQQ